MEPTEMAMDALATQTRIFIPVCCVCGLARESSDPSGTSRESWSEFDEYLTRHSLHGTDYRLTHAYCPICVRQYVPTRKKSIAQDGPVIGAAADITTVVVQTIRQETCCDLDALVRACPQLTWNQIFLEVDRLSRTGDLQLTLFDRGRYVVSVPNGSKADHLR